MYLSQDNLKTQLKAPMSGNLCRCRLQQRLQGLQVKQLSPCFCYFPLSCYCNLQIKFLDAIVSPSSYPCQSVDQWVSQWFIGTLHQPSLLGCENPEERNRKAWTTFWIVINCQTFWIVINCPNWSKIVQNYHTCPNLSKLSKLDKNCQNLSKRVKGVNQPASHLTRVDASKLKRQAADKLSLVSKAKYRDPLGWRQ